MELRKGKNKTSTYWLRKKKKSLVEDYPWQHVSESRAVCVFGGAGVCPTCHVFNLS